MNKILYLDSSDTIGQVQEEYAEEEITRMNKSTGRQWIKNYTQYLVNNNDLHSLPIKLSKGYCWIIAEQKTNTQITNN